MSKILRFSAFLKDPVPRPFDLEGIDAELDREVLANADLKRAAEIDPRYFFYRYVSGYADLEDMRRAGLIGMIGMAFVFIFSLKLKPPKKDD